MNHLESRVVSWLSPEGITKRSTKSFLFFPLAYMLRHRRKGRTSIFDKFLFFIILRPPPLLLFHLYRNNIVSHLRNLGAPHIWRRKSKKGSFYKSGKLKNWLSELAITLCLSWFILPFLSWNEWCLHLEVLWETLWLCDKPSTMSPRSRCSETLFPFWRQYVHSIAVEEHDECDTTPDTDTHHGREGGGGKKRRNLKQTNKQQLFFREVSLRGVTSHSIGTSCFSERDPTGTYLQKTISVQNAQKKTKAELARRGGACTYNNKAI